MGAEETAREERQTMAFLKSMTRAEVAPLITGRQIYLRGPLMSDYQEWAELRTASRSFLTPWEPTWPSDDLSRASFRRRIRRYQRDVREDIAYPFLAFRRLDDALIGGCTLSNVQRGVQQSCALGYWAGEEFAGKGYITEAVKLVSQFVFDDLQLNRLQAACLLHNEASKAVLTKAGFSQEGVARNYLKINGRWQDHLVFSILENDPRAEV
ncbi:MAG: ribosomal-protein-alanine N-acetyltransferase [Parvibaculaceae bacterium]|jgi:ribosomal-protein-alanine N-acetyltransferase